MSPARIALLFAVLLSSSCLSNGPLPEGRKLVAGRDLQDPAFLELDGATWVAYSVRRARATPNTGAVTDMMLVSWDTGEQRLVVANRSDRWGGWGPFLMVDERQVVVTSGNTSHVESIGALVRINDHREIDLRIEGVSSFGVANGDRFWFRQVGEGNEVPGVFLWDGDVHRRLGDSPGAGDLNLQFYGDELYWTSADHSLYRLKTPDGEPILIRENVRRYMLGGKYVALALADTGSSPSGGTDTADGGVVDAPSSTSSTDGEATDVASSADAADGGVVDAASSTSGTDGDVVDFGTGSDGAEAGSSSAATGSSGQTKTVVVNLETDAETPLARPNPCCWLGFDGDDFFYAQSAIGDAPAEMRTLDITSGADSVMLLPKPLLDYSSSTDRPTTNEVIYWDSQGHGVFFDKTTKTPVRTLPAIVHSPVFTADGRYLIYVDPEPPTELNPYPHGRLTVQDAELTAPPRQLSPIGMHVNDGAYSFLNNGKGPFYFWAYLGNGNSDLFSADWVTGQLTLIAAEITGGIAILSDGIFGVAHVSAQDGVGDLVTQYMNGTGRTIAHAVYEATVWDDSDRTKAKVAYIVRGRAPSDHDGLWATYLETASSIGGDR